MLVQHFATHSDHFQKCVFPVFKLWHLLRSRLRRLTPGIMMTIMMFRIGGQIRETWSIMETATTPPGNSRATLKLVYSWELNPYSCNRVIFLLVFTYSVKKLTQKNVVIFHLLEAVISIPFYISGSCQAKKNSHFNNRTLSRHKCWNILNCKTKYLRTKMKIETCNSAGKAWWATVCSEPSPPWGFFLQWRRW